MTFGVHIQTIPHAGQRYDTCGDWRVLSEPSLGIEKFRIDVSALGDWRYETLVAIHELVEAVLCHHRGISDEVVTAFDKAFDGEGEPGDSPDAPYRKEHFLATIIELMMASELGVDWALYEAAIERLSK